MDQAEISSGKRKRNKKDHPRRGSYRGWHRGSVPVAPHRQLGLKVRAFEAGSGVGGTWYGNVTPVPLRFSGRGVPVLVFRGFVPKRGSRASVFRAAPRPSSG